MITTSAGDLCFNDYDNPEGYLHLLDVEGTDFAPIRAVTEQTPQRDGAIMFQSFLDARFPLLRGMIVAPTIEARVELERILRVHARALLNEEGILTWQPTNGVPVQLRVRLNQQLIISGGRFHKEFQFGLIATNPNVLSQVESDLTTAELEPPVDSWGFPFSFPFSFGAESAGGDLVVVTTGDLETFPRILIYGPAAAPIIRNLTTGRSLSFVGLSLAAGDFAEVDCWDETVYLNSNEGFSLLGAVDIANSDFWQLAPGLNLIQLVASGFDANTRATIFWRDSFA